MLVLSRKIGEKIRIGHDVVITLVDVDRNKARIGIEAPSSLAITRDDAKARVVTEPLETAPNSGIYRYGGPEQPYCVTVKVSYDGEPYDPKVHHHSFSSLSQAAAFVEGILFIREAAGPAAIIEFVPPIA